MTAAAKIQKDLDEMRKNPPPLCSAGPRGPNAFQWQASIYGPRSSLYEGGVFKLTIDFPPNYPDQAPNVKFLTQIYHMNINEGYICLDILGRNWKSSLSIRQVLMALTALLTNPNPDDPLSRAKAVEFRQSRSVYMQKAMDMTAQYAKK